MLIFSMRTRSFQNTYIDFGFGDGCKSRLVVIVLFISVGMESWESIFEQWHSNDTASEKCTESGFQSRCQCDHLFVLPKEMRQVLNLSLLFPVPCCGVLVY
jgi:hypothetical protein